MVKIFEVSIVSHSCELFSGMAEKLFVTGVLGELEILSGHAPLLTQLAAGPVWVTREGGQVEGFVTYGGMLEVQPDITIVLADECQRAEDIDAAAAMKAKNTATKRLAEHYDAATCSEINLALAKIRIVDKLKRLSK